MSTERFPLITWPLTEPAQQQECERLLSNLRLLDATSLAIDILSRRPPQNGDLRELQQQEARLLKWYEVKMEGIPLHAKLKQLSSLKAADQFEGIIRKAKRIRDYEAVRKAEICMEKALIEYNNFHRHEEDVISRIAAKVNMPSPEPALVGV